MTLRERFEAKYKVQSDGCWQWQAAVSTDGYGRIWNRDLQRDQPAHVASYELNVGPVPPGLLLDHLCRNRLCVNPAHLEPVTQRENVLRGEGITARQAAQTHCKNDHQLSGDNLHIDRRGHRICRTCNREKVRRQYYAKRGLPVPLTDELVTRIEAAR